MIPLKAENLRRTVAIVNLLLIAVNIAVFLYQVSLPRRTQASLIADFGVVPARAALAIKNPPRYTAAAVIPLVTSMFLHGGWLHLLGNMLFLWVFGASVEDRFGHFGYLAFYMFSGLAAGITHIIVNWGSRVPSIGASGAISGVMGAYIMMFPASRILTLVPLLFFFFTVRLPAFLMLGYWFLIQFLSGMSALGQANQGGVAWWAHIGGFLVGAVAGLMFRAGKALSGEWKV